MTRKKNKKVETAQELERRCGKAIREYGVVSAYRCKRELLESKQIDASRTVLEQWILEYRQAGMPHKKNKKVKTAQELERRYGQTARKCGNVSAYLCRKALLQQNIDAPEGVLKHWILKYRSNDGLVTVSGAEKLQKRYGKKVREICGPGIDTGYKLMKALTTMSPRVYVTQKSAAQWLRKYGPAKPVTPIQDDTPKYVNLIEKYGNWFRLQQKVEVQTAEDLQKYDWVVRGCLRIGAVRTREALLEANLDVSEPVLKALLEANIF